MKKQILFALAAVVFSTNAMAAYSKEDPTMNSNSVAARDHVASGQSDCPLMHGKSGYDNPRQMEPTTTAKVEDRRNSKGEKAFN